MSKKEDNALQIYFTEESDLDLVEENKRYTIRSVTLDTKSKVTRELTNIRIHMIDFGFDEFDSETYQYIKEEIERCRIALDEDNTVEASIRVVCMQFLLGFDMNMITVVKAIINNKVPLPKEFFEAIPQKMLEKKLHDEDEDNRRLGEGFNNNKGPGDGLIRKKRGK